MLEIIEGTYVYKYEIKRKYRLCVEYWWTEADDGEMLFSVCACSKLGRTVVMAVEIRDV